jgi:hypothetical protein
MPWGFLLLQLIRQVFVQSVEALLPEHAVLRDPVGGRAERSGLEAAVVDASLAAPLEEPGFLEHPEVLRDRRQGDIKGLRELGDAGFPEREPREDGATRRIRERREGAIEGARIVNH